MKEYNTVNASQVSITELMLPSHSNFSGKIHGGHLLNLMDQIAFACASKYSGSYCVTASVDTVNFLNPVEIGELVTMNASVNYVGKTSMVVGIRVTSQNIQTGEIKHTNSSYFTMVAKKSDGTKCNVPKLVLSTMEEVRRFYESLHRINRKKDYENDEKNFDYTTEAALLGLQKHNVLLQLK